MFAPLVDDNSKNGNLSLLEMLEQSLRGLGIRMFGFNDNDNLIEVVNERQQLLRAIA